MDSLGMRGPSLNQDSLHSVLNAVPRGLTVGPFLANDGQLGLWCVGHALQKGMLLGVEDQSNTFDQSEDFTEVCIRVVVMAEAHTCSSFYDVASVLNSFCFRQELKLIGSLTPTFNNEIPKDLDKGGKQDTEELMMAPDLFNTRERRYTCDQCDKSFFQLYHLKKHKFTHLDLKPYLCTECGRNYSSQENFRAHLLMHKGERPFKCQQCDKSYGMKRDLKEHEVLHTGERPFVCDICGKAFARWPSVFIGRPTCPVFGNELANSGSLRNHMCLHTGERPYACLHCNKTFRQQGNLLGHLHIHTGEKPYKCNHCNQYFSQVPELCRHLLSHTGEVYLCPICGKALRDPHTLRCELCGKAYTMATKLRCHMKSHLEEKSYKCPTCGAGYTLMQSLVHHQFSHQKREDRTSGELANSQTVVYVQAIEDLPNLGEVILNENIIEIIVSDSNDKCIVVREHKTHSNLVILHGEDGLSSVAETIEIETGV
uniref:Zinc finger protein 408 n=1 Tax=Oncorhynchus kisutch TaxID=8019 RepID=A0A8C7DQG3_ONCKI